MVRKDHPHISPKSHLAISELNEYRQKYLEHLFAKEIGELTEMEKMVLQKLKEHETLTDKLDDGDNSTNFTFGQRVADKIASFGGSWTFIIMFLTFILIWMALNIYWLANKGFDPYPFILLNLILSCLAALQAPVIMMSQNRQEEKDRQRAKNDYMINLKSELEVRILHEKIDHLILHQQQDMMEIQQTQLEMLNEVNQALKKIAGNDNNQKHTNSGQA
ncbi:putative membrane protein [Chitinophaga sp. S165]|nr:putative membrane protein [Chitinophaga sp. S165]